MASSRIGVVVPTRDRSENIKNLIRSLESSHIKPDICLIVDSSSLPYEVVSDSLSLLFLRPDIKGQVRQRNYGINVLSEYEGMEYALILDDDIVIEKDTIGNLISGVKRFEREDSMFVGFSLNVINFRNSEHLIRRLLLHPKKPGSVNMSAINSSLCNLNRDIEAEWVLGGASLWNLRFLQANPNDYPFQGKAYGEDFYYSSKVRPIARFAAISAARCSHNDIYLEGNPLNVANALKAGQMEASVRMYIARTFPQYSVSLAICHIVWVGLASIAYGVLSFRKDTFFMGVGRLVGLFK